MFEKEVPEKKKKKKRSSSKFAQNPNDCYLLDPLPFESLFVNLFDSFQPDENCVCTLYNKVYFFKYRCAYLQVLFLDSQVSQIKPRNIFVSPYKVEGFLQK